MLRLISVATVGLACLLLVNEGGQTQEGGKDKKEPKTKGALPANWKKLNLSGDQVQKIYAVQGQYKGKIQNLEEQIKTLRAEEKTEMTKILTEQQKSDLRKILLGEDDKKSDKGDKKSDKGDKGDKGKGEKKPDDKKPDDKKADNR